ncbi:hypothetical protein ACJJTC_012815 [Scirpophaga incertulas]
MAEKPPEEGYISVVDEEPEIFELLKWDHSHTQKQQEPVEKAKSPFKRHLKVEIEPFDLPDSTFLETYRLPKDVVRSLINEVTPVMPETTKSIEFSVESKVLAALSFYASGKFQKTMGGKSDPTVTQYFVGSAVQQVTEAINHPSIVKKYIHFPHLRNERDMIKTRFYMKYGIPNVVGCIDCTHVPIARPDDDQKIHFNKSYHSKKVQIICDSELNIISVDASAGGSYSCDAVLHRHAVRVDLESLNNCGENAWLIAGPFYTQRPYVMTPIPKITKKTPASPEKYYASLHSQAHAAITDVIKQLKSRWKCLETCNKQFEPGTVAAIIVACCVLHNVCNSRGMPAVPMTQTEERLEAMKQKVANGPIPRKQPEDTQGVQARAALADRLWSERRVVDCAAPKKRVSKKPQIPEPQPMPIPQPLAPVVPTWTHDDNKRPRILSSYNLGIAPGWGHYGQQ